MFRSFTEFIVIIIIEYVEGHQGYSFGHFYIYNNGHPLRRKELPHHSNFVP